MNLHPKRTRVKDLTVGGGVLGVLCSHVLSNMRRLADDQGPELNTRLFTTSGSNCVHVTCSAFHAFLMVLRKAWKFTLGLVCIQSNKVRWLSVSFEAAPSTTAILFPNHVLPNRSHRATVRIPESFSSFIFTSKRENQHNKGIDAHSPQCTQYLARSAHLDGLSFFNW